MKEALQQFLGSKRIGIISVEMPDGSPYAATVHLAHKDDPLTFVFLTGAGTNKVKPLLEKESVRAALVVGSDEEEMKTLQLTGIASITEDQAHKDIYFGKFPEKGTTPPGPGAVFVSFTPHWWRYTDWKRPEGKTLFYSDGRIEVAS